MLFRSLALTHSPPPYLPVSLSLCVSLSLSLSCAFPSSHLQVTIFFLGHFSPSILGACSCVLNLRSDSDVCPCVGLSNLPVGFVILFVFFSTPPQRRKINCYPAQTALLFFKASSLFPPDPLFHSLPPAWLQPSFPQVFSNGGETR